MEHCVMQLLEINNKGREIYPFLFYLTKYYAKLYIRECVKVLLHTTFHPILTL